jgi:hypothetical protein
MRTVVRTFLILALVLAWSGTTQAQDSRIAAFALNCFVPTTPGLHTRAVMRGKVRLATRTVRFVASCVDGPSVSQFPVFQRSDGTVLSLDVSIVTSLENGMQQTIAQNRCHAGARNGFLTFRCMASADQGGEVDVLVSIAPLNLQEAAKETMP